MKQAGGSWSADNGVWEVGAPVPSQGTPAPGPENCHQGSQCAGTALLSGALPGTANSGLVSPSILLPEVAGDQEIHLRVWQWFSYATFSEASCDYGAVQVSIYENGVWSEWMNTGNFVTYSSSWAPLSVDLTQYAGTKMRIAFRHITDSSAHCSGSSMGWYIDEVEIITNTVVAPCSREP